MALRLVERSERELGGVLADSPLDPAAVAPLNVLDDSLDLRGGHQRRFVVLVRHFALALGQRAS